MDAKALQAGGSSAAETALTAGLPLRQVLAWAIQRLAAAGNDSPRLDAEVLLAHVLGQDRAWLYQYPQAHPEPAALNRLAELLNRRQQREPVAYLTGHKEFFGLEFEVNPSVLIPRPETELLVETALQLAQGRFCPSIVDVGTGSGCIAVALARHLPAARIWAVDISCQALAVARRNVRRHTAAGRVNLVQADLLQPVTGPFDVIASNPPYVSPDELGAGTMQPEVARYEPRLALDGGNEGLAVIDRLLAQARTKLKPGGQVLVEIGAAQGQAALRLARAYFPGAKVELKQDLAGLDRLLVINSLETGME